MERQKNGDASKQTEIWSSEVEQQQQEKKIQKKYHSQSWVWFRFLKKFRFLRNLFPISLVKISSERTVFFPLISELVALDVSGVTPYRTEQIYFFLYNTVKKNGVKTEKKRKENKKKLKHKHLVWLFLYSNGLVIPNFHSLNPTENQRLLRKFHDNNNRYIVLT